MNTTSAPKPSRFLPVLALAASVLIAYLPAMLHGGYIWDDDSYVTQNELLTAPDGLRRIWFNPTDSPQYYPMVFTTLRIETALWGSNPAAHHIVNVLLHVASAMLLWLILRRLNIPWPWFAAAVFALHPLHVESVAWITERKNVLSAFFYMLSFLCYHAVARPADPGKKAIALGWYLASLLMFLFALLSKTVTCTLPVVLIILLVWRRNARPALHALALTPFLALGLAFGLMTAALEVEHVGAVGEDWNLSLVQRFLLAGRVSWFYVGKLLWPANLAFVYPRWTIDAAVPIQWIGLTAALAVPAACWFFRRRFGLGPLVAVACYVVTLGPAMGFVDVFPMRYAFVADHFAYLASVPIITLVVVALSRVCPFAPRLRNTVLAVVLVALGIRTFQQAGWYRNEETLWRATLRADPDAAMPHYNLAKLLLERNTPDALAEAVAEFAETLRIKPTATDVHENLGLTLARLGRYDHAAEQFRLALTADPQDGSAHSNLATAYRFLDRPDDAIRHYRSAISYDPGHVEHYMRLADLFARQQRQRDTLATIRAGVERHPNSARLCNSLAALLARARDASLRDGPAAVVYAKHACQLAGRRNPQYLHTLADAFAEAGQLNKAIAAAERAMRLARSAGATTLHQRLAASVKEYRRRRDSGP